MNKSRLALWLIALSLMLVACEELPDVPGTGEGGTETTAEAPDTTSAPDTTRAPDTTAAPDTTVAPDTDADDGEEVDPAVIWLIIGVVLVLILLGWLMGRGRGSKTPVAPATPAAPGWRDHLRQGYGEARWLADSLTEELAIWRGNAMASAESTDAGTELADRWSQVEHRYNSARDAMYQAEASAPDATSSQAIRRSLDALAATRSAIDSRAEARRAAAAAAGDASAAERERISSTNLAEARASLNEALTSVSGLI